MKYIDESIEGIVYKKRPGAYALVVREEDDLIGIITDSREYFFLGGGIEKDETVLEALHRETKEEIGYLLKDIKNLIEIGSYSLSKEKGYLDVEAYIHTAKLDKKICEPVEKDHSLIWVNPKDYIGRMSQRWQDEALRIYMSSSNKTNIDWEKDPVRAHVCCTHNRKELEKSSKCGCFYCLKIYDSKEIVNWTDGGSTAVCPYCGVDSVLYENSFYPVTEEFLKAMKKRWF